MRMQRLLKEARRLVEVGPVSLGFTVEPGQWFRQKLRDYIIFFRADVLLKNGSWKGKGVNWDESRATGGKQDVLHTLDLRQYKPVEVREVPPKVVAKAGAPLK